MENTNMNALGRPVTLKDIAKEVGLSRNTVKCYLDPNYRWNGENVRRVRETAAKMGYSPKEAIKYTGKLSAGKPHAYLTQQKMADALGTNITYVNRALAGTLPNKGLAEKIIKYAEENGYENHTSEAFKARRAAEKAANTWYYDTAFHTRQDLIDYMRHLRSLGYGNTEIARKAGVARQTVQRNIGPEPSSLAKHTRAVAQKLRAQKNAARRSYLRNQPIAEYNMQVAKHNELKAKVAAMEAELTAQKPAIEKAAAEKVSFPLLNLSQLSPTALQ